MIVIYEELGNVHGYYHEGIAHINENLPEYLKKHVKDYLEKHHEKGTDLKVYYLQCIKTDPEIFQSLHEGWSGRLEDYMSEEDIRDIAQRMRNVYPQYAHIEDDDTIIKTVMRLSSKEV